jgi:SOS-response transcriptional repressor LexA
MTPAQRKVYEFLCGYSAREGWMPTQREIMDGVGLGSVSTVHDHLHQLEQDGFIEMGGGSRAIRLTARRPPIRVYACSDPEAVYGRMVADDKHAEDCLAVTHEARACDCGASR